ncbi:hypothetical protein [Morganella morganii]|uniref:hypothetical protein n=1 Tax=Morganella morganii TaxID=582 RepID=UPI000F81A612|nr:hypothetical protein [Morganella morganii]RTY28697.1 hypothetical protein EKS33_18475 [Morganella morganii subsp. morganii]
MAAKNGRYVVGCKLPNGLIIRGAGKQLKLQGANSSQIIGGYGTTEDVPVDIWDDFAKNFADSAMIRNGVVFAVGDMKSVKDVATERENVKTGLEQKSEKDTVTKADKE